MGLEENSTVFGWGKIKKLPEKKKVVITAEEVTKLLQEKYGNDVLIEVKK